MHVEMNGKVSVYPTGRPPYVEVYHRLKGIKRNLVIFKREFDKTGPRDLEGNAASTNKANDLRSQYMGALNACSGSINGWHSSKDKFYEILRIFLERTAANDHTVLPFYTYMVDYKNRLDGEILGQDLVTPFGPLENYRKFIGDRVDEAIASCRSYLCMLSESMDSGLKEVRLGQLLSNVFEVQKKLFILKSYEEHYPSFNLPAKKRIKLCRNLAENVLPREYSGVTFKDNYGGSVVGFEPLLHILPMFLITNAMKATTLAYDNQVKPDGGSFGKYLARRSKEPTYEKIPIIVKPKIEVAINEENKEKISITISDNGIGMSKQMLYDLLTFKSQKTVFGKYTESGGACMHLIGHILDFAGGELHAESEIGQGSTFKIMLPKKLEFN